MEDIRDFGSELTKNTLPPSPTPPPPFPPELELLMEDSEGDWCVEINHCMPCGYTVSFTDVTTSKLDKCSRSTKTSF